MKVWAMRADHVEGACVLRIPQSRDGKVYLLRPRIPACIRQKPLSA